MTPAELRALLAKATPGPWHHAKDGDDFFALFTEDEEYAFGCRDDGDEENNAAAASAAVNALQRLLDIADAAIEEVRGYDGNLKTTHDLRRALMAFDPECFTRAK